MTAKMSAAPVRAALPAPTHLTSKQKAAVIVRFLMNEGADVPVERLSEQSQSDLTEAIGSMRYVTRETLASVLAEFASEIEAMGLTFPQGLAEALATMEGRISAQTAVRLRKEAGVRQVGDPWERIRGLDTEHLLPILKEESTEVAAVLLSKLPVPKAAVLLGQLPGPEARRISYAVSLTGQVTPEAVDRIGLSLAAQTEFETPVAFSEDPAKRLGAILNVTGADTREQLLQSIEEDDEGFSRKLRKSIFTFAHIPSRIAPVNVPRVIREVDQDVLLSALSYAQASEDAELVASAEFVLSNLSKRMAEGLREEISEIKNIKPKDGEAAMSTVIGAITELLSSGEITLIVEEDEDDDA